MAYIFMAAINGGYEPLTTYYPRDPITETENGFMGYLNTFRFGGDYTPLAHHLRFGEPGSLGKGINNNHMYGIFANMYHEYHPNVGKYTSPMDPMGTNILQVPLLHPFVQRF